MYVCVCTYKVCPNYIYYPTKIHVCPFCRTNLKARSADLELAEQLVRTSLKRATGHEPVEGDATALPETYVQFKKCVMNGGKRTIRGAFDRKGSTKFSFVNVFAPYSEVQGKGKNLKEVEKFQLFPAQVQYFFCVDLIVQGEVKKLCLARVEWPLPVSHDSHPFGYSVYHKEKAYTREEDKVVPISLIEGFVIMAPYKNYLVCIPLIEVF